MPQAIRAILFDFDGVLVNSELLHLHAFQKAATDAGIEPLTEREYFEHLIGFDERGVWREIATRRGLKLDNANLLGLCAYKAQVARDLIGQRKYTALPGVDELVRGLWRHYPLAIVSGALRDEIESMLDGIGLRDCFRAIVAAEDVSVGKPDPEGYLKACDLISRAIGSKAIKPASALIFEDAPRVIERVRDAGFQTVGVPTHYGHDELKADFAIKSMKPADVTAVITGLKFFDAA